jgi:putative ABC transport system ATP-binding protein
MSTLLKGTGLIKTYGAEGESRQVLANVDISIKKGEFVSIMGPSGSGKSTLLYTLSGIDIIETGSVMFDQSTLENMKEKDLANLRRGRMGFVFQQPTMLNTLSILDNIILPAFHRSTMSRRRSWRRPENLWNSRDFGSRKPGGLRRCRGGQLQRAGICRALLMDPDILFCDEPTGALDSRATRGIMDLSGNLHRSGMTILLVTHDARVAARAERVLFMFDGKVREELVFSDYEEASEEERVEEIFSRMNRTEIVRIDNSDPATHEQT